jgi:hypothetical protein
MPNYGGRHGPTDDWRHSMIGVNDRECRATLSFARDTRRPQPSADSARSWSRPTTRSTRNASSRAAPHTEEGYASFLGQQLDEPTSPFSLP